MTDKAQTGQSQLTFIKLDPPERKRTYMFGGGNKITFTQVSAIAISSRGTHRLECAEGRVIVAPTWLSILLDMDHWTF